MSWVDDYKKDMGVQDTGVAQPTGQKKLNWTEDYKNDAQAGTLESVTAQPKTSWMPDLGNLIPEDSPVNAVLTQQDLNEMGGTVKDLGKLAMRPYGIIEGAMEFGSAMPGFLTGLVGAGQEISKAFVDDISRVGASDSNASLGSLYDAAARGFQREAEKLPAWDSGRPETKLVGRLAMAPFEAIQGPLHALAESDVVKGIPLVGDDIRGLLKFLGDAAGLVAQHGMSVRGQVYDPKIKLFKEKAEKGTLTEADKVELTEVAKQVTKDVDEAVARQGAKPAVDPLAKLDEAYKPEPPQAGVKPTGQPTHTFVSNRGNEYVKIDGSWYSKDTSSKVINKHIIAAAEAKAQTLDARPTPETLAESHQLARKESETTKALHEARTGAEARRTANEEFQQEIERARKAKETPEVEIVEDIDFNVEAKKALEETGETKPVEPVPETKPVVELDPKAPDYVAQTFKHRDIEIKTGKAEKRSIQARLKKARKEGEISHGDAVRGTTIDELLDLLRTKPGENLRSKSETGQIHATPMLEGVNETVPIYGDHAKHSVAIIIPKKHTMKKEGAHTVEVLVNPETPINELRFVIGKDKRILTADQVKQELLKLKKEKPKVETEAETKPVELKNDVVERESFKAFTTLAEHPLHKQLRALEKELSDLQTILPEETWKDFESRGPLREKKKAEIKELEEKMREDPEVKRLEKIWWDHFEAEEGVRRKIEFEAQVEKDLQSKEKWDKGKVKDVKAPVHGTDVDNLEGILENGLRAGSALDLTPNKIWAAENPVVVVVPSARKGTKIEHNNYYKSANTARAAKVFVDLEQYSSDATPKILEQISQLRKKFPDVQIVVKGERKAKVKNVVEPAPTAIKLHKGEEAPKVPVETKVPEFPKEALKDLEDSEASKKAKKKQVLEVDGVEEYDIVSKEYESFEAAQRAAEKSPQLAKRRKELAETGVSLEVVKVGDKFYAAERLSMTGVERQAIMDALEGSEKTTVVEPDVAMKRLKAIAPEVVKWHKGDSSIPIDALMDEVASMVEGSKGKTDPLMAEVVTAADKMLTLVKEKQQAQLLPQKTGKLMVAKSPKNPKLDIVLDKNGQPFEDMVDALNHMNEHGLKGVVENSADGKGFVIELREPTAFVRTKRESSIDLKGVLDELKQEDLADLGTVESSKPKGRGKRKIVEETLASESGQTTFFTDMWKWAFKKSHKPTLTAAEFQRLPGQRIDALRRLTKDAMDKGISVEDLAKGLGFSDAQARLIQGLTKDVMHYVDRNMSYHDTNAFKSGGVANGGPTAWQHKQTKEQLWIPEISQGELAELKAAKVIDKGLTGGLTREWLPTVHAVNDFKSPLVRALHRDSQRLQIKVDKDIRTLRRTLAAKQKDAGKDSGKRIYQRALWEQKDLRERMEAGGITEADIPVLTPKEQAIYEWMRNEYELAYPEINDVRAHIGKRRMRYTPDYMTLFFADGWANKAGHAPNCVLDTWGLVNKRVQQFKETKFDFSKTRSKKKALSQISENAYDVFDRYMEQKIRFATLSPLISKIAQMNRGLKDGVTHYTTKKGEAKTKPKIYLLKHKNPVLSEFLNRWSNHLAGRDTHAIAHLSDTPSHRFWEKVVRKTCGNVAVSTLGFMFRSAAIQMSALRNTMVVAGLPYTVLGALESLRPKNFRETLKESGLVEYRRGETILEDWYRYTEKGGYEGLKKASMAMLQFMDVHTAVASYRALKRYALKELKLKEKEARKYADEMVTQTQASALPGDIAPIQRSTMGKAMTLFQTFTINDWAFMYKEVFGIDRTLSRKEKVKRMVAAAVGTAMFTSLYEDVLEMNSPFPTPFRTMHRLMDMDVPLMDKVKVVGKEFMEPLPGIGGAARYGSHPLGIIVDLIGQFFRSDPMAKPWWETSGRLAPAPGFAQGVKSWRGMKRGADFWEILFGQPPAKQKILGRTPGRKTVKY